MPYGTSQHQARIRFPSTEPTAYAPIGPVVGRDWAANNVNHYSDIHGQRRACFMGSPLTGTGWYQLDSTALDRWVVMYASAEFPIALMPDGRSYRIRIRVAGSSSGGGDDARFAVVLAPLGAARGVLRPGSGTLASDAVWLSGVTNTTTASYRTGVSQGPEAWDNMVGLTAAEAAGYLRTTATLDEAGGNRASVRQCLVALTIFAMQADVGSPPRLHGFTADEWVG